MNLTPAVLRKNLHDLEPAPAWFYEIREARGCSGSTTTALLRAASPRTLADLDTARVAVELALESSRTSVSALVTRLAGPEPRFDASFDGVRSEFERLHLEWETRCKEVFELHPGLDDADAWRAHGFCLVDSDHLRSRNSHYVDDPGADELWALGHEESRGCRCGHSGESLLDPDDLDDLELPSDILEPRALATVHAGATWVLPGSFLALPAEAAVRRLGEVLEHWEAALATTASTIASLESQLADLPTPQQMTSMRPSEYLAAEATLKANRSLEWNLRQVRSQTSGRLLYDVCSRLGVSLLVEGFTERNDYGWQSGAYRSVAERLTGDSDPEDARGD